MPYTFEFEKREIYKSFDTGITIEAILSYGGLTVNCEAKVDTGAQVCLFSRDSADILEIDVESGYREKFRTLAGTVVAYEHEVSLETLGLQFQTNIFFAESYEIKRNLLGRHGWLQLLKLGLVDYDSTIYMSPYS